MVSKKAIRVFNGGATRDSDVDKLEYRRALSPKVLNLYMDYLSRHRIQSDGELRDWDNWKGGIPQEAYMSSLLRHMFELWTDMENGSKLSKEERRDLACAIMFNSMGFLFEDLREE
jgi:hypothetical protein